MANNLARIAFRTRAIFIRIVNIRLSQIHQFGHPFADIARGIEFLRLRQRRHDPHEHIAVDTSPCGPLPIDAVAAIIGVDKRIPKPFLAFAPVNQQVLDQERRSNHPHPIVHPPSRPQLPHSGIDNGIARPPFGPRNKICVHRRIGYVSPRQFVKRIARVFGAIFRHLNDHILRIVPPNQFL